MVKVSKQSSPNSDVDFDTKMKVVMEMKLFRAGVSKYRTVALLAKDIAKISPSCAHKYARMYEEAGGMINLESQRKGNKNASKRSF